MKLKHWLAVIAIVIGVLYVWHVAVTHGGRTGFLSGLGFKG